MGSERKNLLGPTLGYGAPLFLAWLLYGIAFYPGLANRDVESQLQQIADHRFDDWHPVTHTLSLWAISRCFGSLGAVSLTQIAVAAALFGTFFARFRRLGSPRWLLWFLAAWLAACPAYGLNLVSLWKDAPFGLAVLWTSLIVLVILEETRVKLGSGIWLGVAGSLVWLLRHNGPAMVIPLLLAVGLYGWRHSRIGVAAAVTTCLIIVVPLRGGVFRFLHVHPRDRTLALASFIHETSGMMAAGTPLSSHDQTVLAAIRPLPLWTAEYDCNDGAGVLFDHPLLLRASLPLLRVWAHLVITNPYAFRDHWVCATRFIWNPYHSSLRIVDRRGQVRPSVLAGTADHTDSRLEAFLTWFVIFTFRDSSVLRALFWQPAGSLYVVLACLVVAVGRVYSMAPAMVLFPALANTLVYLALPFSPYLRFQWPVLVLAPVALCLATMDWTRLPSRPSGRASSSALLPSAVANSSR